MNHRKHLLSFIALCAICIPGAQSQNDSQNCSDICGDQRESIVSINSTIPYLRWIPSFDTSQVTFCEELQMLWLREAREFMKHLGYTPMNDAKCPKIDDRYYFYPFIYFEKESNEIRLPDGLELITPGKKIDNDDELCTVTSFRGIYNNTQRYSGSIYFFPMITATDAPNATSTLSEFVDLSGNKSMSFYLKSNSQDTCSNTTCKEYTVIRRAGQMFEYSLFVDWPKEKVPAALSAQRKLKEKVQGRQQLIEEANVANIAILCLPLLLSIPPISLLESVSVTTTLWYVLATDVFAVVPALIKGGELLFLKKSLTENSATVYVAQGQQLSFFEGFRVSCKDKQAEQLDTSIGVGLIVTGLWFMFASVLAEFVTWRSIRIKNELGARIHPENSSSNGGNSETDEQVSAQLENFESGSPLTIQDSNSVAPSKVRRLVSWSVRVFWKGRRKWILFLSVCVLSCISILFANRSQPSSIFIGFAAGTSTIIIYFLLTSCVADVLHRNFLIGMLIALCSGPLYIGGNFNPALRRSAVWEHMSFGGHFGLSIWTSFAYMIFNWFHELRLIVICQIWTYIIATISVHMIRSSVEERRLWKFSVFGIILGLLFGPFCFLFRKYFPDVDGDSQRARALYTGFLIGTIAPMSFLLCFLAIRRSRHSFEY